MSKQTDLKRQHPQQCTHSALSVLTQHPPPPPGALITTSPPAHPHRPCHCASDLLIDRLTIPVRRRSCWLRLAVCCQIYRQHPFTVNRHRVVPIDEQPMAPSRLPVALLILVRGCPDIICVKLFSRFALLCAHLQACMLRAMLRCVRLAGCCPSADC